MERTIIESPFAGKGDTRDARDRQTMRNIQYLRACMRDSLCNHEEAPYASHGLYTQPGVLDDTDPDKREHGIQAGFKWGEVAEKRVFYVDLGVSRGMEYGMKAAVKIGQKVEERRLGENWRETQGGVLVSPALAATLRHTLKGMKNRYLNRPGFSYGFSAGYQQGLAEARDVVSNKLFEV